MRFIPGWFPGGEFQNTAKKWRQVYNDFIETPVKFVKDQLARGKTTPSMVSMLLENCSDPQEEWTIKLSGVSMYGGGADTVS